MSKITRYKIGRTYWSIEERIDDISELSLYRVFRNGKPYDTANGNDYVTETEAEINILLEYLIRED